MPLNTVISHVEKHFVEDFRRVFSALVRLIGDWDCAEEATHEAFAVAVEKWTLEGVPSNPVSWLISTGKFKAIDLIRSKARLSRHAESILTRVDAIQTSNRYQSDQEIEDDRLRLIFACCHPAIDPSVQIPLTLREVCGLTTDEIANAFLVPTATMAQRIVRGKTKIRAARIPVEIPQKEELPARFQSVLAIIYLVFNEGYVASQGDRHIRKDLTEEAIRLCRLVVHCMPEPEAMGLLALMLLHESRRDARLDSHGDIVLLEDQDRQRWDYDLVREGLSWIQQAVRHRHIGPYQIQALISSVHATSREASSTNWSEIVRLYDYLLSLSPSPVIELNRAVAIAMSEGPHKGLVLIDSLLEHPNLASYHLAHAAKADMHRRLEEVPAAVESYRNALQLVTQSAEKRFLERRIVELEAITAGTNGSFSQ